jgi:hypothetical protein
MQTYVIYDKLSKLYKIGKTKNIIKRFSTLSTSNLNLELTLLINGDEEKFLHKIYENKIIEKEWFNLNHQDILDLEDFCLDRIIENFK